MDFIIEVLTLIQKDEPPPNQQGLPQYYREQVLILCDVIERLTKMKDNLELEINEFERWSA